MLSSKSQKCKYWKNKRKKNDRFVQKYSKKNINMKIYLIWLIGVVLWNFGYPSASPLEDVIAAVVLSFISIYLKKFIKD